MRLLKVGIFLLLAVTLVRIVWIVKENGHGTNSNDNSSINKEISIGLGADPDKLPPDQREKWNYLRNIMISEAHRLVNKSLNPSSVHFISAFGMEDDWECWDVVAQNAHGDMVETLIAVSPKGKVYMHGKNADYTTSGFSRVWNSHCSGKKPFVDVTNSIGK